MFADERTLAGLIRDWRSAGGTVSELVDHYGRDPNAVLELAALYDLDDDDMQELVELNELAERLVTGDEPEKEPQVRLPETRDQFVKRVARELLDYKRRLEAEEIELSERRRPSKGKKSLPPEIKAQLQDWLDDGHTMREFFELNEDVLNAPGQYAGLSELLESDKEWADRVSGDRELSEPVARQLRQWLDAGRSAKEFFDVNEDVLGNAGQYDLTEFFETDKEWVERVSNAA